MTRRQFKRMSIFALRMVPSAMKSPKYQKILREHVIQILTDMDDESSGCHWSHIIDWDNKTRLPDDDGTCGFAWKDGRMLLCDYMTTYCWENDLRKEGRHDNHDTKTGSALNCCIRAACDVAVSPSAGVLGWKLGDLRKMWHRRKTLPKWVSSFFSTDVTGLPDETPVWL